MTNLILLLTCLLAGMATPATRACSRPFASTEVAETLRHASAVAHSRPAALVSRGPHKVYQETLATKGIGTSYPLSGLPS